MNQSNPPHQQLKKKKYHMTILIDADKAYNKIQFMTYILDKLRIEGYFLNLIKSIYKMSTANINHGEKFKVFPL